MSSTTASESPAAAATPLADTIDLLSLEQALLDVEVANARVIDLTERLTASTAELRALRQQLASAPSPSARAGVVSWLRRLLARPVKAAGRAVLPVDVRVRLRSMLR
jgi:hypothetical protein